MTASDIRFYRLVTHYQRGIRRSAPGFRVWGHGNLCLVGLKGARLPGGREFRNQRLKSSRPGSRSLPTLS